MPHRWRVATIGAGITIAAAIGIAWLIWNAEEVQVDPVERMLTEPEPAWPPPAPADLTVELASTRAGQRLIELANPDAGMPDAGPPIVLEGDLMGMQARTGVSHFYYLEVVIGAASFDDLLPMAVLIHGRGDRARLPGGPFMGLSFPIRVIIPQAPDRLGDGYQWLPVRVGQALTDRLTTSLIARAGELAAMIRTLSEQLPTMGKPILCGFSQGGMLTFVLATYYSDVVGWAFPLASWLPPALVPPYRRPDVSFPRIRSLHGTADGVIPIEPTHAVFEELRERGFDAELMPIDGAGHEMTPAMDLQLHLWIEDALGADVQQAVIDGVIDGGVDGGFEDAGVDAGVRRWRRRQALLDGSVAPAPL